MVLSAEEVPGFLQTWCLESKSDVCRRRTIRMNEDDQKRRKTITSRGDGQDGMTSLSIMVTVCTKFSHTASCLTLTVATNRTSASPVTRSCPVPLSLLARLRLSTSAHWPTSEIHGSRFCSMCFKIFVCHLKLIVFNKITSIYFQIN